MGSGSSKKSPESQPQRDDIGNSTADVLIEPPNDNRCWPVSAPSSTGNVGSLEDGSCNPLQGLDSLSETQNFIRSLSENTTWSFQKEVENVTSLPSAPPPTDLSSAPDSNVSLWPLFTSDTDWQMDFDDQIISEPNSAVVGATPIAVHELDLSPSYNQPTQGSESSGLPRGLIEYLNLSEKVSANATILEKTVSINHYLRVRLVRRETFQVGDCL